MLKVKTERVIEVADWDYLVQETYGRKYNLQQQDGCMERQRIRITVPSEYKDFSNLTVPEVVNHNDRGVNFKAWLERDPYKPIEGQRYDWEHSLWWERNFYPSLEAVSNDLFMKGLLEAGDYVIDIDW